MGAVRWKSFLVVTTLLACEQPHVFRAPEVRGCRTVEVPRTVERPLAADILFVIDNSGSMAEEQQNLAKNASSIGNGGPCGTADDVNRLKAFMQQAGPEPSQWPAEMQATFDDCGFIERLLLYDNDFHIGVITTDNSDIDGVVCAEGASLPSTRTEGLPMRGCLVPPLTNAMARVITPQDGPIDVVAQRFREAVLNVGTCGSALEQGLNAATRFLDPSTERADPACDADLGAFLRPGPDHRLVVLVLSDEEDCSHGDAASGFRLGEDCYEHADALLPTSTFVDFFRNLKGDAFSMAAIVGGVKNGDVFVPGNCRCNGSALNAEPIASDMCTPSFGRSTQHRECGYSVENAFCGRLPDISTADPVGTGPRLECCTADTGSRYVDVARALAPGQHLEDSICAQSYKATMIDVAALVNRADIVELGETPANARQMSVEVKGTDGAWHVVETWTSRDDPRFSACEACTGACHGWGLVEDCSKVRFYGDDVPQSGAEVRVTFLGSAVDGTQCN